MSDIVCVGQLVADILVQNVDQIDFDVDTMQVERISVKNGGDCLNTAINLKKLGTDVSLIGVLGKDLFGNYLKNVIIDAGIDEKGLFITEDCNTSSVIVLINSKGERIFLYYGGSNDLLSFDKIDSESIRKAKIVHVGGTYNLPRFDGKGAAELFQLAHKHGAFTTMDVTWDVTGRWLDTIEPCLPELDLFMPSFEEAKRISGLSKPEEMTKFLKNKGVKHAIIKLGKQGCYVDAFGKQYFEKALDVPVLDTTGAGDSFVAGVLYGLKQKWQIEKITKFASAVSAHCIQQLGATDGVPSAEVVLDYLSKNKN